MIIKMPEKKATKKAIKETCECEPGCICCTLSKKKLITGIVIVVLVILGALYFFRSFFIVALVNGKPISRLGFDRALEKQGGQQVLSNTVTEILINQEAKKQNVTATQADLDQKFTEIDNQLKAQGQSLEAALTANNQTRVDFDNQMKTQIVLEKMLGKDITITDQEVSDYFTKNKATFTKDATLASETATIKSTLIQQKLSAKLQPWLKDLQTKAKILYFIKF